MRRRRAAATLAAVSTAFMSAACATAPTGGTTATRPATEVLTEAAAKSTGQSFSFEQTYGTVLTSAGAQDATGKNWRSTTTFAIPTSGLTIQAAVLSVGSQFYLKLDLGPVTDTIPGLGSLGDKWMRADRNKIGKGGLAAILTSGVAVSIESFLDGVGSAEHAGEGEIRGTLDLTTSAPTLIGKADPAAIGPDANSVPFTATLDGDGRIGRIAIAMPEVGGLPAADLITNYSGYGAEVTITKPAKGDVVAAPAMIYPFLL